MHAPPANPWPPLASLLTSLREGRLSAAELVEESLACAREHAPLNAFRVLHREAARSQAAELDRALAAGEGPVGPLHGLPLAIKDNLDEAGAVCAAGCAAYAERVPGADAAAVARLRGAGAVVIGRTNLHELADGVTSENPWTGPVIHPLRAGHHPGGSSGGSAVAVAAGCVPAALGTDTGGSVRIPAALCGVVGLKPSRARIPTAGGVPLSTTLDHVGILATRLEDVAPLFAVLADPPAEEPRAAAEAGPRPLRLGVLQGEAFGRPADEGVAARFAEILARFQGAGHVLVPVAVEGLSRGIALLSAIYPPEAAAWHRSALEAHPEGFSEAVRQDLQRGLAPEAEGRRAEALAEAEALRRAVDARVAEDGLDLLVSPTTPHPARPLGSPRPHTYLSYTCPFNLTGQPALSVPMGAVDGLPVGLQLVAPSGRDEALLSLALTLVADS